MGIAGTIFPFAEWFNKPEYRILRTFFFVCLALIAIAPLTHLAFLFSTQAMLSFISPVVPSLLSYVAGLFFYVSHFPERITPPRWGPALAWLGGGSHAIWHAFIVLAISQHRAALPLLEPGVVEGACPAVL
ncbi:hemolysin-III related-domain-containing protein [Amylostereum chailletii]|nr:hemolysin-III related-domain-containing protein [Amylostereum chailletii]